MDFDFTDDQESLRDAVRRWVDKGFSFERRHAIAKTGGMTREVYGELAELGLTALAIPEAQGGMGFGPIEAMVVNEELGRGLVNAPYAHAAIVAPTLLSGASADLQAQWLPKIADASALVVLAHQERAARYRLNHVTTRATKAGNGWTLSGAKSLRLIKAESVDSTVDAEVSVETGRVRLYLEEADRKNFRFVEATPGKPAQLRGRMVFDFGQFGTLLESVDGPATMVRYRLSRASR